jgi:quercetin dioxygenase-like cupin family protein
MRRLWLTAALLSCIPSLLAAESDRSAATVVVRPVLSTAVTASGQPIVLPQKNVQVVVTTYDIPRGANLAEHKHPNARYAYVTSGTLRVTNTDTGKSDTYKAGDFIVEAIGQWHKAANIGKNHVKLVVIDQVEGDQNNTVLRQ